MRIELCRLQTKAGIELIVAAMVVLTGLHAAACGDEQKVTAKNAANSVSIHVGNQPVATYFFADEKIARPFYAHVFSADGNAVTRTFPPNAGEPDDHADMHPGIWLAFGDLSGQDFWRNKGRVKHVKFLAEPKSTKDGVSFAVQNEYSAVLKEGEKVIARETCRHTWSPFGRGILLSLDSEFESTDPAQPLVFGDQEEMGLGIRMASQLRVKDAGGEIRSSSGQRNEKQVWGKQAKWCDYRGKVDGREAGITLMAHPDNFRESWFHVRDYGLMVANPFGQNAFTGKEKSHVEVKPGEKLRLRFGVWIHSGKETSEKDLEISYQDYVQGTAK